jgi:hypothetical protein
MIIKCKMCGGDLAFEPGSTVCECEYCGSKQTIPSADNEKKTNLFNRANRLRMNSEFDKASGVYEQIVAEFPEEAEAYWGLCLCAYGIEYVDDPATGSKIPTCHRTLPTSIMEDSNFEQACDYADPVARKVYREEAKTIDRIQKDILSIAQNETPYDVFICYKETAEDGSRTEDSVLAQDVYEALTAKGLKVFFSRITLEDKLGTQYEPYIYAALSSAKVMLAFGTTYEYYDAVWVKNEWSRFLGMMKADKRKVLIPCFKGLDAYDMPKEFRGLQAQDMAKLGWMQDLVRGVEKLCGKGETAATVVQKTVVQEVQESGKADNLMKRVYLYLEDEDFEKASEYIDKVLDVDAEYAPAYVAQILVENKLTKEADLTTLRVSIDDDPTWKKALRFANEEQKQLYLGYAKQSKYAQALEAISQDNYAMALSLLKILGNYQDSRELYCRIINKCWGEIAIELAEFNKPKVLMLQEQLKRVRQQADLTQKKMNEQTEAIAEAENRKSEVQAQIARLNGEINKLHGLFSGKKKQMLLSLEKEKAEIERRKSLAESEAAKVLAEVQEAQRAVEQAQAALKTAEEGQTAVPIRWSDEKIIEKVKIERAKQEKEIEAKAKEKEAYKARFTVGNYITFGTYPQTEAGNDESPIEWMVLERKGKNALLISRYGLDAQPFNNSNTDITWEECTLRQWLNITFFNKAFTRAERTLILTTAVDNSESQCYDQYCIEGGNNTQDKIFLLSYAEANKYFGVTYEGITRKCNTKGRLMPTAYAITKGASNNKTSAGVPFGWWWLRSPANGRSGAACVINYGTLYGFRVDYNSGSVRPAMWVNIDSLINQD